MQPILGGADVLDDDETFDGMDRRMMQRIIRRMAIAGRGAGPRPGERPRAAWPGPGRMGSDHGA